MAAFDDLDDLEEELDKLEVKAATAAPTISERQGVSASLYFQQAGRQNISWYHQERKAWLRCTENGNWQGWSVESLAAPVHVGDWTPWEKVLDESDAPFYRWYTGGLTNAAFSEVDIHVLQGAGDQLAYIEEPDPSVEGDVPSHITRGALLARSAAAAKVLSCDYGLNVGDRVLFFLPIGIEQITWVEACKRLGIIYCCCNPSLPPEQIADRVVVLGAKVIISAEHPDWSYSVHKALNDFMPVDEALERAFDSFSIPREQLEAKWASRITVSCREPPFTDSKATLVSERGPLLNAKVLILGMVKIPMALVHKKTPKPAVLAETWVLPCLEVPNPELQGPDGVAEIWKRYGAPVPLEANFPMFIMFTSGTTGKPKGICHVHGYVSGLVETMRVVFNADPARDRMLTVGALGWITGQSYQVSAVLASGVTSILMRGNPVQPSPARFAEVISRHGVTILKAGSAFLREVMATPEAMEEVRSISTRSLRIATFCAEPVSEAVQAFAQSALCPMYINSYWATEHGGIVWSRRFGAAASEQPLRADARAWPLPWVDADVYVFDEASKPAAEGGPWRARPAECGERAEVVCTSPYPYMFRYVWGDVGNFGKPGWTGDRRTMLSKYWRRTQLPEEGEQWVYVQGDFAARYTGGAYSFHGRSDEVLNINGMLFGTEHIEGAILRDKHFNPDSPVGHCVVVGYPDEVAGEVPMAFLTQGDPAKPLTNRDFIRLFRLVEETVGALAVRFVVVSTLPQTFSGKFLRRVLAAISRDEPLGDLSTVSNPECITKIKEEFADWKRSVLRVTQQ